MSSQALSAQCWQGDDLRMKRHARRNLRMVTMMTRPPVTPSNLTDGWHPAYLLHISEEATPGDWEMFKQSPMMYRWHFAAWESPAYLQQEPEVQSGLTSTKFTP